MNAFCISTLLIPLASISLPASSSLSSSADNSRTSSSVSPCSNIGVAIMREHDKHAKLDQQNSTNKTRKLSKSNCRKKPRSGILSSAVTQASNRVVEKFSENLPTKQSECEAQFTFKN